VSTTVFGTYHLIDRENGTLEEHLMNSENSALTALSELKNLEADRIAREEHERMAAAEAERRAREEADRRAREEAERRAAAEAARLAAEHAEREAREREERVRIGEAEARARAEQEGRLREEQMRIDAQMQLAERKARPKWPLVVVPILVATLGFGGWYAWDRNKRAEEEHARLEAENAAKEEENRKQEEMLATITADLKALKEEQDRLENAKNDLDKRLSEAATEAERSKLLAEKQALESQLAANEEKQVAGNKKRRKYGGGGAKKSGSDDGSSEPTEPKPSGRKNKINLGDGNDPLSGL
jgi:hypothetical protein